MRQEQTKTMLNYWMELYWQAGNQPDTPQPPIWPERSDIEPARCRELLANMFILERGSQCIQYRLAGTSLCSLFGRELKHEPFSFPFSDKDRRSAENWVERLGIDDHAALLCSTAETAAGETVQLETLLLPLCNNGTRGNRIVGLTVPCELPFWLGGKPVVKQSIRSVRLLRPWEEGQFSFGKRYSITDPVPVKPRREVIQSPPLFDNVTPTPASTGVPSEKSTVASGQTRPEGRRQVAHLTVINGGLN